MLLLPGVVRGPDGRLRIKGGQPTPGRAADQQREPDRSVDRRRRSRGAGTEHRIGRSARESVRRRVRTLFVEHHADSHQARHERVGDQARKPLPARAQSLTGVRGFEPRFSVRGPIKRDRAFLAQDLQFRYVTTPVKSLPDEPEIELTSFDSFTRVDAVVSARHTLGGGLIMFPRRIKRATMNTFRPPDVTPDFSQSGWSLGAVDRLALARDAVLETTLSGRWFEVKVNTDGRIRWCTRRRRRAAATSTTRSAKSRASSGSRRSAFRATVRGQHVFKVGIDLQRSTSRASAPAGRSRSGAWTARSRSGRCSGIARSNRSAEWSSRCSRRTAGASAHE